MSVQARPRVSVMKLGGSVLTSLDAYRRVAAFLADEVRASGGRKLVAVVSAEEGHTDALAREAEHLNPLPQSPVLDLLWSTGELRSVALLTLALGTQGVAAIGLNAHQTGLRSADAGDRIEFNLLALRAGLARHDIVVVPGFLATRASVLVTLGRGGSDLSAVLLARALHADECVLVKDVDGYFTDDPATNPDAQPIEHLTYAQALDKADRGCPLVQRQALHEGCRASMPLIVRSMTKPGTVVHI